jgi:putative pyrroloquinoline-quinone-binding quinoprotein
MIAAVLLLPASVAWLNAQRGGGEWTTSGFDAQRTAWLRADQRLTKTAVQKGEFQLLWKMKVENTPRQLNSLTPPVLLDRLIGYRGFKSLAFFGASADRIYSVDTDLARPYWTAVLNYTAATGGQPPPTSDCPGGLVAMPSRRTALAPPAGGGGGGGGGRAGVRNGSAVGEPGKGAAVLAERAAAAAAATAAGRGNEGRGGQGRGNQQGRGGQPPGRGTGGLAGRGGGFGGVEPLFAIASDGFLHALYVSNGADVEPAIPFLPPDAKPSSVIMVDGAVYTTTSGGCGAAPNAVWGMDVSVPAAERKTMSWQTGGANIAGSAGLAFGTDGTIYVATSKWTGKGAAPQYADAVVALDRETLKPKDWFSAPGADFNASPIVIRHKEKDYVAVTANDGKLYVLDGASLGGSDRKTPLAATARFSAAGAGSSLATFEEQGARYIATTASAPGVAPNGRIVAFKLTDEGGRIALTKAWESRGLTSPLAPIVVNGMVIAVSSGEFRGAGALTAAARAQRSVPAVLYVLDAASGKPMWSSGTKIASFARSGLSAGGGQVYVVTYDNHLYAFGVPMEH